jgi:hypothetical protein
MADASGVQLTAAAEPPTPKRRSRDRYPTQLPTAFTTEGDGSDDGKADGDAARVSATLKPHNPMSRRSPSMMSEFSDLDGDASDYESDRRGVGGRPRPRLERRMSTIDVLYQMQNLQLDDEDEESFKCCDFSVAATSIHPHSTFRTRWDLAISLMLAYNAFTIPYRVCFGDVLDPAHTLWYAERLIDVAFIADVVVNFYTGYVRSSDGQVELTPKLVRWNYFTSWFAIDFVSSVPYEVIVMIIVDSEDPGQYSDSPQLLRTAKALKIARYIRFLKVVKVLRLVRAVHIFKRFEKVSLKLSSRWSACCMMMILKRPPPLPPPPPHTLTSDRNETNRHCSCATAPLRLQNFSGLSSISIIFWRAFSTSSVTTSVARAEFRGLTTRRWRTNANTSLWPTCTPFTSAS